MERILIVDDEESVVKILSILFAGRGYETGTASDGEEAMEVLLKGKYDVLLTDVRMRPMDGLALLKFARSHDPGMQVIMLTAYASVESAIEALKIGAFDYVTKPFDVGNLVATVERAMAFKNGATGAAEKTLRKSSCFYLDDIIAESQQMQDVCNKVQKIASADTIVTIIGDAGCGKGLIAKALHNSSKRKNKAFHRINCAIMPEPLMEVELLGCVKGAVAGIKEDKKGLFELVRDGTIFLEEIGGLTPKLQETLLKIFQTQKVCRIGGDTSATVSSRVIVSSHTDLEKLVKQGKFREDLFLRLNVLSLRISPLRDRREDIVPLFAYLFGKVLGRQDDLPEISAEVQALLQSYAWPGNAEELENAASYAALDMKGRVLLRESLPSKIANTRIDPAIGGLEPVQARNLKAFLLAEGAGKDLQVAEESIRSTFRNDVS